MAHFVMVIADSALEDAHRRTHEGIKARLEAQVEGLRADEISSPTCIAAKMWLSHSASAGFGRDARTGSRLAFIGNPTETGGGEVGQGEKAQRAIEEYLVRGREAITALNAPFACVIFDGRDGSVNVVTDRLGLQMLYEGRMPGASIFSTSSAALACATGARFDGESVVTYFRAGHLLGEQTLYGGISKVGAAKWLKIAGGRLTREVYWRPPATMGGRGAEEWGQEVGAAAVEALGTALAGGGATTVELTGGLDTRMNLAAAVATGRPFAAWTITDINAKDSEIAARLAAAAQIEHIKVSPLADLRERFFEDFRLLYGLTDGELDCLNVISSASANRQTVSRRRQSVTGVGGELMRGFYYRSKKCCADEVSVGKLINWQLCLGTRYDARIFNEEYGDGDGKRLRGVVRGLLGGSEGEGAARRLDEFYFKASMQAAGGRSMTFNNFFYRQAAPFCSNRMLDAAFSMPAQLKRTGLGLRRAVELFGGELAEVELTTGLPARRLGARDAAMIAASYTAYGKRVLRKLGAKTGLLPEAEGRDAGLAGIVREKVIEACKRELLGGGMASEGLYRMDEMRRFLRRNIEEGLPDKTQVGLMLSMELTARYLGGCGP